VALGISILSIDVTRRREAEQALQQAMRTEALGRLAAGVAHDFNSLLAVIAGYASVLERSATGDQRDDVHQILEAVRRASRMTGQLLAFARHERVAPELLDPWRVVDDVLGFSKGVLGAGVELAIPARPALPRVRIDPGALEQVLLNLLMNARDAMGGRGRIALGGAVTVFGPEETVRVRGERIRPGAYVHLTVTDTGVGMSPEVLARLFDPFFTTKGEHGHGLGLASSFGLVRQAEGYLTAESVPGAGSTFHLYLPVAD
jgi:signal transduction histidine kinase